MYSDSILEKLRWSLPWLSRYPFWRARELARRASAPPPPAHLIIVVANHFEPAVTEDGLPQLEQWCKLARSTGDAVRDHDGTPFRHTNFFPAEQYERRRIEMIADLQADGFGEVEVHFHHGIEKPDTAENTRQMLSDFRDRLAEDHRLLSRQNSEGSPRYAFVHGNWALANSAGGRFCGVDGEMQTLAETGCYADMTLPSTPSPAQISKINSLYECDLPLSERAPHRRGRNLRAGQAPSVFPLMIQ